MSLALQVIDFLCWNKKLIGAEAITGGTATSSGLSSWALERGVSELFFQRLIAGKSQPCAYQEQMKSPRALGHSPSTCVHPLYGNGDTTRHLLKDLPLPGLGSSAISAVLGWP